MISPRAWIWVGGAAVGLALAGAICGAFIFGKREPHFAGRSLGDWSREYHRTKSDRSELAIRSIGSNAVAYLVENLTNSRSPIVESLVERASIKPYRAARFGPGLSAQQIETIDAFTALGTNAIAAIPELAALVADPEQSMPAVNALIRIGPPATRPVLALLRGTNETIRVRALMILARFPAHEEIYQALLETIAHAPRSGSHGSRAKALSMLTAYPEHKENILALLIDELIAEDGEHRAASAVLSGWGAAAEPALPFLKARVPANAAVVRQPHYINMAVRQIESDIRGREGARK